MRAKPGRNDAVQLVGIQSLDHPANGAFAGAYEFAGFTVTVGAQAAELVLVEGLGKGPDIDVGVVARNHGRRRHGDNGGHFAMAPSMVAAWVAQGSQGLEEAFSLLAAQGIFQHIGGLLIGRPGLWHDWGAENLASFGTQRPQEDGFGFVMELIEVDPGAAKTSRHSDFNPIGGAITSAFEPFWIYEGFDQGNGMAVALLPVLAQPPEVQAQDLRCDQGGARGLGTQQNESGVTGH